MGNKNLKIGIDAKWLYSGPISGRLFIQNILPEMFALYPEIEWHIFLDKKNKHFRFPYNTEKLKVHYVWAKFNMVSNFIILPRYAKRLRLDALLFQTFSPKGRHYKSIVFVHDVLFRNYPEYFSWKERLYFFPLRWSISLADRAITTSEFVKKELHQFHYVKKSQPIDIAPSGVTEVYKPEVQHDKMFLRKIKEKYNLPDSYILFTGRLNARKNINGLINAFLLLDHPNIYIVIVGEKDWKSPQLRYLLADQLLKERIIFTGLIPDDDLAAIYAMAKIFCFPSYAEGFGLPPLEAMASGIPVVVSNTTAMPEVCGNAALFVDPKNEKEIAEKINDLLQNEALYNQKKQEGLEWSKQYKWKKTAEKIMQSIFTASDRKQ